LIEKGSVGEPVRGATLIGNGPKVLQEIDMVGNDLGFGLEPVGKMVRAFRSPMPSLL